MTGLYAADGSYNVTMADLNTAIGSPTDEAWDGSAASASLISIMKAVHAAVSV